MEDLINLVFNQSVAIAMLLYFVLRFEKILKTNTDTMRDLINKIQKA